MISPNWAKSTYSNPSGSCVEARKATAGVQVRDTKDAHSPILEFAPADWQAFIDGLKR